MLAFAPIEITPEQDQSREALESLGNHLQRAQEAASRCRVRLPNRDKALAELSQEASRTEREGKSYLGIFAADVLSALRERHGSEVSEYLLDEISRKQILPLLPGAKMFRWSAQAVLAVWRSNKELKEIQAEISDFCQMPFVCRAFVGTRIATFYIPVRLAVWEAQKDMDETAGALDGFLEERKTR